MSTERIVPVLVSVVVIVLVALVQERSRYLAALVASVPLTAPLALWIVYSATHGSHRETAEFAASLLVGFIGGLAFIAACWFALSREWSFGLAIGLGFAAWLAIALAPLYRRFS